MTPLPAQKQRFAAQWRAIEHEIGDARQALIASPPGIARHLPFNRLLGAQRRCRQLTHHWLANALHVEAVADPRLVLSLDVDELVQLEGGMSFAVGLTGAAALRLLQLGHVAVLPNTARSLTDVKDLVAQFVLPGGMAALGTAVWDGIRRREKDLTTETAMAQLGHLRVHLRAEPDILQDETDRHAVGASRLVDGYVAPISGQFARGFLERCGLGELGYWVGPTETHFVDRRVDKADALATLQRELALDRLPLAAMGSASNDVRLLRTAALAFLPAATVPSYRPPRRQRLVRSRHVGDASLWEVACWLVPNPDLQAQVLDAIQRGDVPAGLPTTLRGRPETGRAALAETGGTIAFAAASGILE